MSWILGFKGKGAIHQQDLGISIKWFIDAVFVRLAPGARRRPDVADLPADLLQDIGLPEGRRRAASFEERWRSELKCMER